MFRYQLPFSKIVRTVRKKCIRPSESALQKFGKIRSPQRAWGRPRLRPCYYDPTAPGGLCPHSGGHNGGSLEFLNLPSPNLCIHTKHSLRYNLHRSRFDTRVELTDLYPRQFKVLRFDNMGSVVLPHLVTGWHVDQAIMSEDERLVVIRFGRDWDPDCMRQDEVLYRKS